MREDSSTERFRVVERPNFFDGMVLTADDLRQEQEYSRDRERAHNRLHGWGVVSGLEVAPTRPASGKVVVLPGSALDCYGREVVLTEATEVDILGAVTPERPDAVCVVVCYGEEGAHPVSVADPDGEDRMEPSWTREVPVVGISECEDEEGLCLVIARIDLPRRANAITARLIHGSVRKTVKMRSH